MTEVEVWIASQGMRMVGTLALPPGGPAPVVLMLHGFTGARDETAVMGTGEGVFSRTARLLAGAGYASLRVDFIGSGESEGDFADTTYEGQVADGLAALAHLHGDVRVQGDQVLVLGWSQGGLVATAVAGRSAGVAAVALWAAVADPVETFGGMFGAEAVAVGLRTGQVPLEVVLPDGARVALKQGYFEGMQSFKPLAEIAAYGGPVFVAHGTQDDAVLPVAQRQFTDAHRGRAEVYSRDMDHCFNVSDGPDMLDRMVAATIAFFDRR